MIAQRKTGCGSAEGSVGMLLLVTVAQDEAASSCGNEEFGEAGDAGVISPAHPLASGRCGWERWGVRGAAELLLAGHPLPSAIALLL